MLLRSTSVPSLGAFVAEGNRHDCSNTNAVYRSSRTLFGINIASPAGRSFKPSLAMRRACSETDLQAIVCAADTTEDRIAGEKTSHANHHSNFQKLSIIEETDLPLVSLTDGPTLTEEDFHSSRVCSGTFASRICTPCYSRGSCSVAEMSAKANALLANSEGIFGGRGGSGGGYGGPSGSSYGDSDLTDLRYKKLLKADPQNPLLLRNYAQYLAEKKHDYKKSEEYYERAILACPSDGEVLSTYAKQVWEVHKDSKRAGMYFDQAVAATPDDCYVLASHASFLWQSEEDEDVNDVSRPVFPTSHSTCTTTPSFMASA